MGTEEAAPIHTQERKKRLVRRPGLDGSSPRCEDAGALADESAL